MNIENIAAIWGALNNPLVQLGGAALFALALALAAYAIRTQPRVADVAQDLADLLIEIEGWVVALEKTLLKGEVKYSRVIDQAQAWLAEQGITGRKARLIERYLPGLIELTVKRKTE